MAWDTLKNLLDYAMENEEPPSKHSQSWNSGGYSPEVKSEDGFNSEFMSKLTNQLKNIFSFAQEKLFPPFSIIMNTFHRLLWLFLQTSMEMTANLLILPGARNETPSTARRSSLSLLSIYF